MKKITLVIFAFLLSFNAFAQFPEGFEGTWTTGSGPAGWAIINAAGPIQTWQQQLGNTNFPAHSGSYAAFINRENVADGTTTNDWLITPAFTVPANGLLKFWSRLTLADDQGTVYKIFIGNSTTDITQFTELQSWTELTLNTNQTEYELKQVSIPASYTGQTLRLAFVMQGDNGDRWLVDDVDVVSQCFDPTTLSATNITGTGASLSWTDVAGTGAWEIEVVPSTSAPTGTGVTYTGALPYTVNNLDPSTSYSFYVRSKCQPDGNNSAWVGPYTFMTTQIPATLNWSTDFESASIGFTIVNGTQTNKWVLGTAVSSTPTHSLYVSNDNGATNSYSTSSISTVHAYRDVFIPATANSIYVNYDWRNVGESGWDYIRLWGTPATYTPVAGTQTTAVNSNYVNYSGDLVGSSAVNWTTGSHIIDVTAYRGTVRRFIFEWRNDGSGGSNPPGAIDNVGFTLITCPQPTNLTSTALNMTTADLAWTEGGSATAWEVYVVPVASAAPTSSTSGVAVTGTPAYTAQNLTPGTSYKYYVRSSCGNGDSSIWSGPYNFNTQLCNAVDQCTYTFNLTDSFGDGWNGNTMAVTQNGVTIATLSMASGSAATQTVTVCNNVPLTLFWNTGGSFATEVGVSVVNGFGQVLYTRAAGTDGRNTTLYTGNVSCNTPLCLPPSGLTVSNITQTGATLTWGTTTTGNWEYYIVPAGSPAPTSTTPGIATTTNTVTLTNLNPSTTYTYYVRIVCDSTSSSTWSSGLTFTTVQIPAQLNYTDDFESALTWTFVNGTATNKWVYGTAVSNSPTHSLYISNDNGVSNAYTTSASSIVHAYRDVAVPAGTTDVNLSFDWRNLGEGFTGGAWDYINVYMVPTSYSPVAGTTVAGGTLIANLLWNNSSWTTINRIFNASAYAGSNMRIVFQWTNDSSGGSNPPGAIDNVVLTRITCPQPTAFALTANSITQNGAAFTWTEAGSATSWEVIVQPASAAAPTASSTGVVVTTPSYTATGLNPSTAYVVYVRAICSDTDKSLWSGPISFTTNQIPGTLNYTDDFEGPLSWTFVNGTATNKWVYGTAVSNSPTHSLYITNDNGVTNAYSTGSSSIVHAYRDIEVPTGTTEVNVAFDWRAVGEGFTGGAWDYINVYAVPTTYFPTAGTAVAGGTLVTSLLWNSSTWTNFNRTFNASAYAGSNMRIVFQWTNDGGGGSNPPGAIDNVVLTRITCPQPTALALLANSVTQESASFTWTELGTATSWEVIVQPATAAAPTASSTGVVVTSPAYTATGLTPSTAYVVYVRALCSDTDKSLWTGPLNFTTTQIPGTINYTDDFEGDFNWTLVNGTQTNKWFYGTAVSSSPTHSLYVTNTNGTTNAYSTSSTSVVQAYRDIAVPAGYNDVEISFKWKGSGETNFDYLTAFVVPTTYVPTAGTNMIGATTGGTQITGTLGNNNTWTTFTAQQNVSAYAGGTMRIVFQWQNDGSGGTQPPAAVDDVTVTYVPCANPSGIVINCLTNEGINLSWNDNATSWEVAVLPTSAGVPTSATVVNEPNYTYEGALQQGVAYTAYVRTVCSDGSGYSGWSTVAFVGPYVSVGNAQALCAGVLAVPQQSNSGNTVPAYGTVGCLFSTPNPTWYYVTLGADGAVSLNLSQTSDATGGGIDVDFAIFGPFESKLQACSLLGSPPNTSYMVDCSYSASSVEQIDFSGNAGDVFALLVTNFNGAPGHATITQISGPAISCNPTVELGANRSFCDTDSYNLTATVDNPGEAQTYTYTWFKDTQPYTPTVVSTTATTQTIQVTDEGSHVYSVVVTMPNPTTTDPVTDQVTIALSHPYTAPVYDPIVACSTGTTADVNIGINYLGTLDATGYTLVGVYPSLALANAANTPGIDTSAPYTTGTTTLYAVVTDALVPTCKKIVPLQITVTETTGTLNYNAAYCTSDAPAQSGLVQVGGTAGTYEATPAGLTIDAASGEITPATSTAGTYHIIYTIPAQGDCPPVIVEDDLEIIQAPVATTVDYPGAYCNTAGTNAVPQVVGTTGGSFTGDAGLVIDVTTGAVDLGASTPGVHQVTYTIPAAGSCILPPVTTTIEINQQLSGTFDYPRAVYCSTEGMVSVTNFVGSINGMYMATPAGLAINPATGEIDLANSTAGIYDVVYHFDASASCPEFTSTAFQITVVEQPVTTIDYGTTPFCNTAGFTAPVNIIGTTGGAFTATPAGLVIDPATGEIDLGASTPNTYTVSYAPPATVPCTEAPVTATVVINSSLSATIAYPSAIYCSNAGSTTPTHVGDGGGVYEFTPAGLVIDATTGEIDLAASAANVYTITYHIVAAGGCGDFYSVPVTVEIIAAPDPATVISYSDAAYCSNAGLILATITGTTGGTFAYSPAGSGLVIDPATGEIDTAATAPGTYQIWYTTPATAPCTPVTTPVVSVTINQLPVIAINYAGSPYCSNGGFATVTPSGDYIAGGTYSSSIGLIINATTGDIDLAQSVAGTYQVVYTVNGPAGCGVITSTPATVVITKLPVPDFTYATAVSCNAPGQPIIMPTYVTGGVAGTFTVDVAGLTIDPATGYIDPVSSIPGTYVVTNTVTGTDGCIGFNPQSAPVTVVITNAPVADFSYSALAYCQASTTTISLATSNTLGAFTATPAGLSINAATGEINVATSTPGTYEVINTIAATTDCTAIVSAPVSVTITAQPVITTLDGCIDNKYTLQILLDTDPVYSVDDVNIVWTATSPTGDSIGTGESVVITDPGTYYVTVTPRTGAVCSVVLPVTVDNSMCNVQRGISPGGSIGQNDDFDLRGLDVRKISIFNRYGKEVYKFEGQYTTQWHGQTSSGEDLPTGTYFYMFSRANGENRTGWIYVNREVK